ncbi:MAG: helix-turn-helix domain-containing protein [Lautropia sp.]|nr:helix-turn-helix domain-containing protein [Lautropia sp.]
MTIEFEGERVRIGSVLDPNCPSRQLLQHLTSRWGVLVMLVLHDGSKRFGELKRAINGISERMLTQTLKHLEADRMLNRTVIDTAPPHVEYSLTPNGLEASRRIRALVSWLEEHTAEIMAEKSAAARQTEEGPQHHR